MADDFTSSLARKVVDLLCGVTMKEAGYMWNCSKNVKILNKEVENLTAMKDTIQQRIEEANRKAEVPGKDLDKWMKNANVEISEARKFIDEEAESKKTYRNLRFCVNLGTLYRYGKMATKKASILQQHQKDGEGFRTCDFHPLPTPGFTDLYHEKNLENMDTQKSTLKQIVEAIEDDTIQIVGINGLGGVGKTTLASEVAVKMKNQFADIVFITVSQTIDANMIREKVQVAARRIKNKEKVLIILDDVWEELKLAEVGIPCGSDYKNCKILLTSRSIDVCEAMNAQKNIPVNPLPEEEAWNLFQGAVGKSVWDYTLKQLALKIVRECGGLPLFVQAIGNALKNKEIKIWEAALGRLQDPTDEDLPYKRKGIMQLKLSYDYLESKEAKWCFLLCSMYPEDSSIDITRLAYYGVALGIFNNLHSIQDAKDRVQIALESLKSSFLLLYKKKFVYKLSKEEEIFKMHDLYRDMALYITFNADDKFLVDSGKGLREWHPRDDLESYKKISLMENKIRKLPDYELHFPHLDTFLIQNNEISIIPDGFFRGMKNLKVLDMSGNNISTLPQSLNQLTKIHMLDLTGNKTLNEISILGELTWLEILKLRSTSITNIPEEIGRLTNLRVLDAYDCKDLFSITPDVISKLNLLEELYVELKVGEFLVELSELKSLKILYLTVPQLHFIPEDFHSETLIEFHIKDWDFNMRQIPHRKRTLRISRASFPFTKAIMKLIQVSECLDFAHNEVGNNMVPCLYQGGFDELKYIRMVQCIKIRSLVKTHDLDAMHTSNELSPKKTKGMCFSQLQVIDLLGLNSLELLCDNPHQYISFCNLTSINISNCGSLIKLFPVSVAHGLVSLKKLDISYCESLKYVISVGDEQTGGSKIEAVKHDTCIMFPLTNINLYSLSKLENFYNGHLDIKYPSLEHLKVCFCPSMKRWNYGDNHMPNLDIDPQAINDFIAIQHEAKHELMMIWKKYKDRNKYGGETLMSIQKCHVDD